MSLNGLNNKKNIALMSTGFCLAEASKKQNDIQFTDTDDDDDCHGIKLPSRPCEAKSITNVCSQTTRDCLIANQVKQNMNVFRKMIKGHKSKINGN